MSPPDGDGAPRQEGPAQTEAAEPLSVPASLPAKPAPDAKDTKPKPASMVERLIPFVDRHFDVFRSRAGLVYGVHRARPGQAYAHTAATSPLMGEIKMRFRNRAGGWPDPGSSAVLADYLTVNASRAPSREVALRSSWDGRRILLDVGDEAWRVLEIDGNGWRYREDSPVPFRRGEVTAALAEPALAGDLEALWRLAPVAEVDRPLVLALLLCAWLSGVAQPIVFVTGPQDAGKTEITRFLLSLVDPVSIAERGGSLPAREEEWKSRVSLYRCVLIDNASNITAQQSDTLCKVATGGEATTRAQYTNDTAHVSDLQAPVWLTSIGVGALRGDLGSRLVRVELAALDRERRLALSDLRAAQDAARPVVLRALLDLAAQVLDLLPNIDRSGLTHRLTDFELVVRCLDKLHGTDGAARLGEIADELAGDVLDADPVAQALLRNVESVVGEYTAQALLAALRPHAAMLRLDGPTWPRTPKMLSEHLQRIAPALKAHGVTVQWRRTTKARLITIGQSS